MRIPFDTGSIELFPTFSKCPIVLSKQNNDVKVHLVIANFQQVWTNAEASSSESVYRFENGNGDVVNNVLCNPLEYNPDKPCVRFNGGR